MEVKLSQGRDSWEAPEEEEEDDRMEEETGHERIERELNELEEGARTGVRFWRAEQGQRIG